MKLFLFLALASLASAAEAPNLRLPGDVQPTRYDLRLDILPAQDTFTGKIAIDVQVKKTTPIIWLNSVGLKIASANVDGKPAKAVAGSNDAFVGIESGSPFNPGAARVE